MPSPAQERYLEKIAGMFTYSRANVAKETAKGLPLSAITVYIPRSPSSEAFRQPGMLGPLKHDIRKNLNSKFRHGLMATATAIDVAIKHSGEKSRVLNNRVKAGLAGVLGSAAGLAVYKSRNKKD